MKSNITAITIASIWLMLSACAAEVVDPELFGDIEGSVLHGVTEKALRGASIETSPATEVITTNADGHFRLQDVPTGNYKIRASKANYKSKSVSIMVREDRTTSARIMLEPEEENSMKDFLEAKVTSWFQTGPADSSHVDIEYRVNNTSDSESISKFEIYFDIHTNQDIYYYEISSEVLEPGEQNFGSFTKYVRDSVVDSVTISDAWIKATG